MKLVSGTSYLTGGAPGCCGIGTIARLLGGERTEAQRKAAVEAHMAKTTPVGYFTDRPKWKEMRMKQMLSTTSRVPSIHSAGAQWGGMAVPLDVAFASVLEYLLLDAKYVCYYLSDNVSGAGDVHLGPFSTRAFHKWYLQNGFGASISTGPLQSLRTSRTIQAWIITPHWATIAKYIKGPRARLIQQIEEINDHECIKQARQDVIAERAGERKELQHSLSAW